MYFSQMAYQKNSEPLFRNSTRMREEDTRMELSPLMSYMFFCHVWAPWACFCKTIFLSSDPAVQDCGTGHGVRSDDMNGLAEMERSQVTYVALVFVHSRHTEHVLHPVLSVTRRRRVQHTLQEFGSGLCFCVVRVFARFGTPAVCNRIGALNQEDFRLHAPCIS